MENLIECGIKIVLLLHEKGMLLFHDERGIPWKGLDELSRDEQNDVLIDFFYDNVEDDENNRRSIEIQCAPTSQHQDLVKVISHAVGNPNEAFIRGDGVPITNWKTEYVLVVLGGNSIDLIEYYVKESLPVLSAKKQRVYLVSTPDPDELVKPHVFSTIEKAWEAVLKTGLKPRDEYGEKVKEWKGGDIDLYKKGADVPCLVLWSAEVDDECEINLPDHWEE